VEDSRFETALGPITKHIIPGKFNLIIEFTRDGQVEEVLEQLPLTISSPIRVSEELYLGEPNEEKAELEKYKEKVVEFLDKLYLVWTVLEDQSKDFREELLKIAPKGKKEFTEEEKKSINALIEKWRKYYLDYLENLRNVKAEVDAYVDSLFIPQKVRSLQATYEIIQSIDHLRFAYRSELLASLGPALLDEKQIKDLEEKAASVKDIRKRLTEYVIYIQNELQPDVDLWMPRVKIAKEEGEITENTYTSKVSNFKITRPNENWSFNPGKANSPGRLDIYHSSNNAHCQIQIMEYPGASTHEEIAKASKKVATREWPQCKDYNESWGELSGKKIFKMEFTSVPPWMESKLCNVSGTFFFSEKKSHRAYIISMCVVADAYEEVRKDIKSLTDSFKVIE
jgi:hypothetical protein